MENVTEYGCERCGGLLIKPEPKQLGTATPQAANLCDECGHVTNPRDMCGFQCSPQIQSTLRRLCSPEELQNLRLDPQDGIGMVNPKLAERRKSPLGVDESSDPPLLFEVAET